jgi:[ribosomal protein S5]-alanine N-acetyltransferase
MAMMRTLVTPALTLEPLTVAHADEMFAVLSDTQIYPYIDQAAPESTAHLRSVYTRLEARHSPDGTERWLNWALRLNNSSAALIGVVQATVFHDHRSWVAYVLNSAYWGQGYASQATKAMMDCLRDDYGVTQYMATVEKENLRSIKLLIKQGFALANAAECTKHELTDTELLYLKG